jgi:Right handed beta helix region
MNANAQPTCCDQNFTYVLSGCTVTVTPACPDYITEIWKWGDGNSKVNDDPGAPVSYTYSTSGTFQIEHIVQCLTNPTFPPSGFQTITINIPRISATQTNVERDCLGNVTVTYTFCVVPNALGNIIIPTTPIIYRTNALTNTINITGGNFVLDPVSRIAEVSISPGEWVGGCATKTISIVPNNTAPRPYQPVSWTVTGVLPPCIEFAPKVLNTTVQPRLPEFYIVKSANVNTSQSGDLITYTIMIRSTGSTPITGGILTEDYPEMKLQPISYPAGFVDDGTKLTLGNVTIPYNTELSWEFTFQDISMCIPSIINNKAIFEIPECPKTEMVEHTINSQAGTTPIINITGTMYTNPAGGTTPPNWATLAYQKAIFVFAPYSTLVFNGSPSGGNTFTVQDGSMFKVAEGAEIVLSTLQTNFINNTFSSCDGHMWKGIKLLNNAGTIMMGCEVFDAHRAITVEGNTPKFLLYNNTFNRNYTGIYMPPLSSRHTLSNHTLQGNHFICSESLRLPYLGQSPLPAEPFGYAGMEIYDANALTIRNSSARDALFSDNAYGIFMERSTATVTNARFLKPGLSTLYGNGGGHGIRALGKPGVHRLTVAGFGSLEGSKTTFEDCNIGIHSTAMHLEVKKCHFKAIYQYGIFEIEGTSKDVDIRDNRIVFDQWGIFMDNNPRMRKLRISENIIFSLRRLDQVPAFAALEINNTEAGLWGSFITHVANNPINISRTYTGIRAMTNKGLKFFNNSITITNPPAPNEPQTVGPTQYVDGISVQGGGSNVLAQNSTFGAYPITSAQAHVNGIRATISEQLDWCSNAVRYTNNGIRVDGLCTFDEHFVSNTFEENTIGLRLNNSGRLGKQSHRGNKWEYGSSGTNWQALHEGGQAASFFSIFKVTVDYPFNPIPVSPMSGWFRIEEGFPAVCDNYTYPGEPPVIGDSDYDIATDAPNYPYYTEGSRYASQRTLYSKLFQNANLRPAGSVYATFYNAQQNQEIGQLEAIAAGVRNAQSLNQADETTITAFELDMSNLMGQVVDIDEQLLTAIGSSEENLLTQKANLLTQYTTVQQNAQNFWLPRIAATHIAFDQLWLQNENIVTSTQSGANEKAFNKVMLSKLLKQEALNTIEQADLQAIAVQCPYDGGQIIYAARGTLRQILGANAPVWTEDCMAYLQEEVVLDRNRQQPSAGYQIAPNPSNGPMTLFCPRSQHLRQVEIFDIVGRSVEMRRITPEEQLVSIDLGAQANGLYYIIISETGLPNRQIKLIKH